MQLVISCFVCLGIWWVANGLWFPALYAIALGLCAYWANRSLSAHDRAWADEQRGCKLTPESPDQISKPDLEI